MGVLVGAAVVAVVWAVVGAALRLADRWLGDRRVSAALAARGVTVNWGSVWWYSSRFNAALGRWARRLPAFWSAWFGAGAAVALGVAAAGSVFMALNLAWLLRPATRAAPPLLTPMLPFVNVPGGELAAYFAALVVATVLHELGHALAALSHGCALEGVGAAIVGVFPAAFVDLRAQDLEWASVWVRLKVHCAGAFHNVVLAAAAMGLLLALPLLMAPLFGHGLLVVDSRSAVPAGLRVTSLNGCPVASLADWSRCLEAVTRDSHQSFCVPRSRLEASGEQHDCCEHDYQGSLQCFHVKSRMYCLSARTLIAAGAPRCNLTAGCGPEATCVDASLPLDERLMWVEGAVEGSREPQLVVLAGSPSWLWGSLRLSELVPRVAGRWLRGLDLRLHAALLYVASLSSALALLNLLPVHFLDGSHILDSLWQHWGGAPHDAAREHIKTGMTVLVGLNLVLSSRSLFL